MSKQREILLTPGPLTTSESVRKAMLKDWGSRDEAFIALTAKIRRRLVDLINGGDAFTCVPLQGSGTFAVEALVGTLLPQNGKLLILVNGAYGERMAKVCRVIGRDHQTMDLPQDTPVDASRLDAALEADGGITHVAVVHCETTSGLLNPVKEVAEVVAKHGRALLIDAMSSFGALPLEVREVPCVAIAASSNKCLEGAPGMGYALVRIDALSRCEGHAHSLSLDLHDQWRGLERNGQWRFTPPTHVLSAFGQALDEHEAEGGIVARHARYRRNCDVLVAGMRELGFQTFLPDELQAPIIVTFLSPKDPNWDFQALYDRLGEQGIIIYPGKLTEAESFRIGCIGQIFEDDIRRALGAIGETLRAMGVGALAPATGA